MMDLRDSRCGASEIKLLHELISKPHAGRSFLDHVKKKKEKIFVKFTSILSINGLGSGLAYWLNQHTTRPLPYARSKNQLKFNLVVCLISFVLKTPRAEYLNAAGLFGRAKYALINILAEGAKGEVRVSLTLDRGANCPI